MPQVQQYSSKAKAAMQDAAPELFDALTAALDWIDAVPSDIELPTMPGFDRDQVDALIAGIKGASSTTEGEWCVIEDMEVYWYYDDDETETQYRRMSRSHSNGDAYFVYRRSHYDHERGKEFGVAPLTILPQWMVPENGHLSPRELIAAFQRLDKLVGPISKIAYESGLAEGQYQFGKTLKSLLPE